MAETPAGTTLSYMAPRRGGGTPIDPAAALWRRRRILLRVGLFVPFLPFVLYFGPNLIKFQQLTSIGPNDLKPSAEMIAVIGAFKAYERDTGHPPDKLEELMPRYVSAVPAPLVYASNNSEICDLLRPSGEMLSYTLPPGAEGWSASGAYYNGPLPLPLVRAAPSPPYAASSPTAQPASAPR